MEASRTLELEVTGVAHGGVFVARHEGRVIFLPDTIPGERVVARVVDDSKASFWRAETLEVLTPSPHRRPHVWPEADLETPLHQRPGGADFGHIDLDHTRALKTQVVRDLLARIGKVQGLDVTVSAPDGEPADADGTKWRTRVSLHVDARGAIGPRATGSHDVVRVTDLPLATDAISEAWRTLGAYREGRVDLIAPSDGPVQVLARPGGTHVRGPAITEVVGQRRFALDAGGFWQVHRHAARTLTRAVREAIEQSGGLDPEAHHLDLYGGVGLLSGALADVGGRSTRLTSVESSADATGHARTNLADLPRATAETDRVDRWLRRLLSRESQQDLDAVARGVVVIDPPRAGAGREVVTSLSRLSPDRIVYVACDPAPLARDLATFRREGYTPDRVRGFDLFPLTHHVEAVTVLTRT